jgi:flagellar M-ring protein FliF
MDQVQQLRATWGNLPRRAQVSLVLVAAATLFVLYLVYNASTSVSWKPVLTNAKGDEITTAEKTLDTSKISYKVSTDGTQLLVASTKTGDATAALQGAGISAGGAGACKPFASGSGSGAMMATDQVMAQDITDHLDECIKDQILQANADTLDDASVNVVTQGSQLFTDQATPATASIVVSEKGDRLGQKQVQAIQMMASRSVSGLKPENVSVADSSGPLQSVSDDGTSASTTQKLAIEQAHDRTVEATLMSQLVPIAGPGNVVINVNDDIDIDKVQKETKNFTQGPAAAVSNEVEGLGPGSTVTTGGPAGTASNSGTTAGNQITAITGSSTNGSGRYNHVTTSQQNDNNETVARDQVAPGDVLVRRWSIIVNDTVPAATANAIKDLAQASMGGNPQDSFSFSQAHFAVAAPKVATPTDTRLAWFGSFFKWIVAALGLLGMAFFLRRSLNQRTEELLYPIEDPLMLEAGGFEPIPLAELEAAVAAATSVDQQKRMELQRKVEQIAVNKPQDVAQQLRGWLHEDAEQYGYNYAGRK